MSAIRRLGEVSRGDLRLPDRFWAKVQEGQAGCWLWIAATTTAGYGSAWDTQRRCVDYAHRIAYIALVGPIPAGREIDHLCRNRACCNPAHLEAVTHAENVRRGTAWHLVAAVQASKTHCINGHEFTAENTYRWSGKSQRHCRTCRVNRSAARRRANGAGVANYLRTECPRGHSYNEENTRISKTGSRKCRECERQRRHRQQAAGGR